MAREIPVKIENRQRLLIILTIAAVALFAADKVVFGPLAKVWKARSVRITELRRDVADGTLLLHREKSLRAHWDDSRTTRLGPSNECSIRSILGRRKAA
jgi:hypothetical protein